MARAQSTPKTVLRGTAMAVAINVTSKAWIVSGSDRAAQTGSRPCSKVL